jgi:hypothetical protein
MKGWLVVVALAVGACMGGDAGSDAPAVNADLTQRQRDSILAQSRIPGAAAVGAAQRAADAVEARVRRADSIGN